MTSDDAAVERAVSQWNWLPNSGAGTRPAVVGAVLQLLLLLASAVPQWSRRSVKLRSLSDRVHRVRNGRSEVVTLRTARQGDLDLEVGTAGCRVGRGGSERDAPWSQVHVEGPLRGGGQTAGMPRTAGDVAAVVTLSSERIETLLDVEDVALLCVMSGWRGRTEDWNPFGEH